MFLAPIAVLLSSGRCLAAPPEPQPTVLHDSSYWQEYGERLCKEWSSSKLADQQLKDEIDVALVSQAGVRQAALKALDGLGARSVLVVEDVANLLDDPTWPPADYSLSGSTHSIG